MNYLKQIPSCLWLASCCLLTCCWGCTNELLTERPATDGTPVKVVAEIEGTTTTKTDPATSTDDPRNTYDRSEFIDGDVILIYKTDAGVGNNQQNYKYTSGEWKYAGGENKPINLQLGAKYYATYPAVYNGISRDQSTEKNYIACNWLKTDKITPTSETLDFTGDGAFKHVNTKLSVTFEGDNELTGTITNLKIKGDQLSGSSNGVEEITPYHIAADKYTWCCILFPKAVETEITISLTYGGLSYQTTVKCGMQAGYHYAYTLRIRNELLVVKNTILEWKGESAYDGNYNGDNNPTDGGN